MRNSIIHFFLKYINKPVYSIIRIFYKKPRTITKRRHEFIGKFKVKTRDGISFYLYNNAFLLETNIFWSGYDNYPWESVTRIIWTHLCRQSDTIFDIGSNTGIYAILAKAYSCNARVFAFEPQPNIFNVLKKNNQINHFDIVCENLALADQEGKLPFYNYGDNTFLQGNTTAGSLNKAWRPDEQTSIMVDVRKLENYVIEKDIEKTDLMKIDVETFEYEVLQGYGKYLSIHKPIIILEIQNQSIGEKLATLFNLSDYTFYNIDERKGLKATESLGLEAEYKNYLLCPVSKLGLLKGLAI